MAIKSIAQFINELQKIPRQYDSELYFRGHSDYDYKLVPTLYRNRRLILNENKLFKEFILRTPSDFLNDKSTLDIMDYQQDFLI